MNTVAPSPVEERLAAVEARLALMELEGAYALAWDRVDAAGWAGLFTDDGVFEMDGLDGRETVRHQGRPALLDFCVVMNQRFRGLHLMHLPTLRIDGDTATGSLHFRFEGGRHAPDAREVFSVTGLYEVAYRLTPDGWRIAHRRERAASRASSTFHPGFHERPAL